MADLTTVTDVDAMLACADNAAIREAIGVGLTDTFGCNRVDCTSYAEALYFNADGLSTSILAVSGTVIVGNSGTTIIFGNNGYWQQQDFYANAVKNFSVTTTGIVVVLAASATPAANEEMVIQKTSNTQLTFKVKGSDGTVRSGSITLA